MDDLCGFCCGALCAATCLACCCNAAESDRNNRNHYGATPVTVTHVTTTPVVQPPYPVSQSHPTAQAMHQPTMHQPTMPQPGFVIPPGGYQTGPYPPGPVTSYYYPPPMGIPGNTPYPTGNTPYPPVSPYPPGQAAPPPSYHEAVRQPTAQPPIVGEQYAKQSPYNPNY